MEEIPGVFRAVVTLSTEALVDISPEKHLTMLGV